MTSSRMTRAALAATTLVLAGGLAACGAGTVPQADVEEKIVSQLTAVDGSHPESASCPGDLDAEVDATMTCAAKDVDGDFDVKVTVTSVDGDKVNYDIEPVE